MPQTPVEERAGQQRTFDNAKTAVRALTQATKNAGYASTPVEGASK